MNDKHPARRRNDTTCSVRQPTLRRLKEQARQQGKPISHCIEDLLDGSFFCDDVIRMLRAEHEQRGQQKASEEAPAPAQTEPVLPMRNNPRPPATLKHRLINWVQRTGWFLH